MCTQKGTSWVQPCCQSHRKPCHRQTDRSPTHPRSVGPGRRPLRDRVQVHPNADRTQAGNSLRSRRGDGSSGFPARGHRGATGAGCSRRSGCTARLATSLYTLERGWCTCTRSDRSSCPGAGHAGRPPGSRSHHSSALRKSDPRQDTLVSQYTSP